jgi:hypothetical protein
MASPRWSIHAPSSVIGHRPPFLPGRYVGPDLLPLGELTRAARNSSQVRRPTARSGARFAPARNARAALPGSHTGTIGRRLPRARRSLRTSAASSYTRGPPTSGTRPAGGRLHAHWWHLWLLGSRCQLLSAAWAPTPRWAWASANSSRHLAYSRRGPRHRRWRAQHGAEDALSSVVGSGPADTAPAALPRDPIPWAASWSVQGGAPAPWPPWMRTDHPQRAAHRRRPTARR